MTMVRCNAHIDRGTYVDVCFDNGWVVPIDKPKAAQPLPEVGELYNVEDLPAEALAAAKKPEVVEAETSGSYVRQTAAEARAEAKADRAAAKAARE